MASGLLGACALRDGGVAFFVPTMDNKIIRYDWSGTEVARTGAVFEAAGPDFAQWMTRAALMGLVQFAMLLVVLLPAVAWVVSGMSSKILDIDIAGASRELASFSRRANAQMIDLVLSAGLALVAYMMANGVSPMRVVAWVRGVLAEEVYPAETTLFVMFVWFVGTYMVYMTVAEAATARTLGKLITGIEVIRISTGSRAGVFDAVIRNVLRLLEGNFLYLIAAAAVWISRNNQRIGDMLAGTLVVRTVVGGDTRGSPAAR